MATTGGKPTYTYNPACGCKWCVNGGEVPKGTPDNGHSFGYEHPHRPPPRARSEDMKIVALLSWFDESPDWLDRCVMSLGKIPVDHIIALDGAYGLFPDGKGSSGREQSQAIIGAARSLGISHEVYQPLKIWPTELVKRDYLFRMGEQRTEPTDWYLVIDSDEYVEKAGDTRQLLETTPFDVGAVDLREPGWPHGTIHFPTFPMFFRAIRGIYVDTAHFRYRTPDGRLLWGDAVRDRLETRQMTPMKVIHERLYRPAERKARADKYYVHRDELDLEGLPSERFVTTDDSVQTSESVVWGRNDPARRLAQ